jgi:hypothetical protein
MDIESSIYGCNILGYQQKEANILGKEKDEFIKLYSYDDEFDEIL